MGPPELLIVLLVVLVLFGGAKVPQLAKSLGEAQREFKRGTDGTADAAAATTPTEKTPSA
jgi:sec-independent protein translocase protein TatA